LVYVSSIQPFQMSIFYRARNFIINIQCATFENHAEDGGVPAPRPAPNLNGKRKSDEVDLEYEGAGVGRRNVAVTASNAAPLTGEVQGVAPTPAVHMSEVDSTEGHQQVKMAYSTMSIESSSSFRSQSLPVAALPELEDEVTEPLPYPSDMVRRPLVKLSHPHVKILACHSLRSLLIQI